MASNELSVKETQDEALAPPEALIFPMLVELCRNEASTIRRLIADLPKGAVTCDLNLANSPPDLNIYSRLVLHDFFKDATISLLGSQPVRIVLIQAYYSLRKLARERFGAPGMTTGIGRSCGAACG